MGPQGQGRVSGGRRALAALALAALGAPVTAAPPGPWVLAVQPDRPAAAARRAFAGVASLVADALGAPVRLRVAEHALAHWRAVRTAGPRVLALDEPQFVDYRVRYRAARVVAAVRERIAFRLYVAAGLAAVEPEDLRGLRLAAPAPPALGGLRVLALFPDPFAGPRLVPIPGPGAAWRRLLAGEVDAALVPLDATSPGEAGRARAILVTDEARGRALTVGSGVGEAAAARLRAALLGAGRHARGRRALARAGLPGFVAADESAYHGAASLLRGTWGYPGAPGGSGQGARAPLESTTF